ncbi:unnamed protein product [Polarella glacialis]|uniref:Cytochrome P450 n=1 Tax=Polarella glacialis TaxID=89957 RepID=A0A813L732_POLGL|nr:unnamed protein product [Polarella glacialis]CAE8720604.1 unnamed protein product [Polarella glacialis]
MLGKCCKLCGIIVGFVMALLGLVCIKPVNDALVVYSQKELEVGNLFAGIQMLQMFGGLAKCVHLPFSEAIFVACMRTSFADFWFVPAHGWEGAGVGIKALADPGQPGIFAFSHQAVTDFVNRPRLTRDPDLFVATSVKSMEARGVVPKGLFPLVISMNTDDPKRSVRRKLLDDFFPSLLKPLALDLNGAATTAGVLAGDTKNASAVIAMVGSSLFQALFEFQPSQELLRLIESWLKVAKPCAANKCPPGAGKGTADAFDKVFAEVAASRVGKDYLKAAAERNFEDPEGRLREVMFITFFAGIGGTSDTVSAALFLISSNQDMLPLFQKDPRAFMIEVARLYPAVAGMTLLTDEDHELTLGNGRKYHMKVGEYVMNWNAAANVDPTVFGGPNKSEAYARSFNPGRDNLERMVTFNGELGQILACDSTVGCARGWCGKTGVCAGTAMRPCPGTRLALHTATNVVKFFVEAGKQGKSAQSEL